MVCGPAYIFFFIICDEEDNYKLNVQVYLLCCVQGFSGRYPSGQRGQTVNLLPSASKVRILACPPQRIDAGT